MYVKLCRYYAAILAHLAAQKTAVWQQARCLPADSARMARGTLRHVDRAMMAVQQLTAMRDRNVGPQCATAMCDRDA